MSSTGSKLTTPMREQVEAGYGRVGPGRSSSARRHEAVIESLAPVLAEGHQRILSRVNDSFIARQEAKALATLCRKLPAWVTPDQLTALGMVGAAITSIALVACNWSLLMAALVPIGLFVHWFGDSLDGSLARHRKIERPSYGFFLDHTSDLFAMAVMIVSFGASPFMTMTSALLVLCVYLLFSAYTYVKVAVEGTHQLAYGGLGSTEFRALMTGWTLVGALDGPQLVQARTLGVPTIDCVIGGLSAVAVLCLAWIAIFDARRIEKMERKR